MGLFSKMTCLVVFLTLTLAERCSAVKYRALRVDANVQVTLPCWELSNPEELIVWITPSENIIGPDYYDNMNKYSVDSEGSLIVNVSWFFSFYFMSCRFLVDVISKINLLRNQSINVNWSYSLFFFPICSCQIGHCKEWHWNLQMPFATRFWVLCENGNWTWSHRCFISSRTRRLASMNI